jgi:ABC-type spermidine/putrescine transport system permease subunit I
MSPMTRLTLLRRLGLVGGLVYKAVPFLVLPLVVSLERIGPSAVPGWRRGSASAWWCWCNGVCPAGQR